MSRTAYEIPLNAQPQVFAIQMAGVVYVLAVTWNIVLGCWVLDIADQSRAPIVSGIPIVTGLDLLAQYEYLGFGGMLIAQTDGNADAVPTLSNLGSQGHLYFVVTED